MIKEAQRKAGTTTKQFEMALIAINKKVIQWCELLLFSCLLIVLFFISQQSLSNNSMYKPQLNCWGLVLRSHLTRMNWAQEALTSVRTLVKLANFFQIWHAFLSFQGDFGAAGTVTLFKDERHNSLYQGFPFVVWTEGMSAPEIRVQPPVCL